jgi:Flp pilus assembly protein TadG
MKAARIERNVSRRSERGNALIEFALLSTVLLLILAGVSGFSRVMSISSIAQGAAEAGVAYGTLSPVHYNDLSGMQTAALADTGNYANATATATQFCTCSIGGTETTCPASCGGGTYQEYVKVSVTIPYVTIFNFPMIPNPINVTQIAIARVQ